MSTYENTVNLVQNLSENDLKKVHEYIRKLLLKKEEKEESYNPFTPLSREEIIQQLAIARKHAEEGHIKDAHQASADIRARYGL